MQAKQKAFIFQCFIFFQDWKLVANQECFLSFLHSLKSALKTADNFTLLKKIKEHFSEAFLTII